jgi:hypothetical protein
MTTDTGNHSTHGAVQQAAPGEGRIRQARSPWLLPGIAVGIAATVLVITSVISVTTLVYVGVIGGMLLMHLGHGAHGGQGAQGGQGGHGGQGLDGSGDSGKPEVDRASSADRPESHSCH